MRTMEFSGRTVDEAIFHGLNEMGVTIDQVDIVTVQNESKGIFGLGARNAIVRLTEREVPVVPDFDAVNEERREQKQAARKAREERPREDRPGNAERTASPGSAGMRARLPAVRSAARHLRRRRFIRWKRPRNWKQPNSFRNC